MKSLLLLAALAASHTAIAADSPALIGPEDCRVVNQNPKPNKRMTWSGGCKEGYADGEGTLVWLVSGKETSRYEGTLKQGRRHGHGYAVTDGAQYEGNHVDGLREGRGIVMGKDGTRYEGDFKAGLYHGTGSIVYRSKARYDGQFEASRFHGKGKAVYIGGQVYEGEFKQGVAVDQAAPVKQDDSSYSLPERSASAIKDARFSSHAIPMDKSYGEMTKPQQQAVRDQYPLLHETDEPPYPVRGLKYSLERIAAFRSAELVPSGGPLDIRAQIDAKGNATAFYVISTPDPKLSNFVASVLRKEKFKPGVCAGKPCTMEFRYVMNFDY